MRRVGIVPGDLIARNEPQLRGACAACGDDGLTAAHVIDGVDMVLCLDFAACAVRMRGGVSPETYAAGLRGEILAVAP